MGSPNEPGSRPVDGDGMTEPPPWQNATRRTEPPPPPPSRPAPQAGPPQGANVRASRYVTGMAAPDLSAMGGIPQRPDPEPVRTESRAERTEVNSLEAYPSELPNLSGPAPKAPAPRMPAAEPAPAAAPRSAGSLANRLQLAGTRAVGNGLRATMQIRYIDPWSALKVSALLNVALFFVWMIAVAFLYLVLGAMGVWSKLNSNVGDLLTSGSGGGSDLVSAGSIFGGAALIGLVNIVLLTAMATVGAYIYNLSTDIVGGVEVTLADLD